MFFDLIKINELISGYQYFVLFPLVVIEGPIVTVIAGFLASLKQLNFLTAFWVIVMGDLLGDALHYFIGRWGKETSIQRWGRYFGITPERVARLEQHFKEHSGKTLLLGKLLHGVGASFLVAAGVARMSFSRFILFNLIGTLPKTLFLMLLGYYFGKATSRIESYFEIAGIIFLLIGMIVFAILYYIAKKKKYD
ncbi:MAG: hypothetical protein UT48_C0010G0082 [Parcubacteria group bacterium GW2011_GWE2_39_37]|uniref:VTT domain-containing protein n=1 Tax=Candidatus Falkowbacteria bacterium GW2011_GWF2_39_8 TaxID=1618642 RepID=A0A0G0PTH1_9BACT|nr:MAG: hypothetical protein UT48_C0010G0082 [Parcubacteria group bacterium GW2011_GWE2_39_37]KKR31479.1 MAG: hypothetical protein UT64_C0059G0002 [Candidatus Falkowbacteria bacterium GW2011_GWF2_39_8]